MSGATKTDHGSYPLTLTASVDAKNVSASFTVQIKDPCSFAVFETTPAPIVNMTVDIFNPTGLNQAVNIYTDVQRSHSSIVCPITATLAPNKNFIQLSANSDQISILTAQIVSP